MMVVYLDSPRDFAVENFRARSGARATIEEFVRAREHDVEREVQALRYEADAVLFNCGEKAQLVEAFLAWWSSGSR